MNRRSVLLLALICGFLQGGAYAALPGGVAPDVPKDAQKGAEQRDALDEVIISARKEKLSVLQKEIEKSEDRFFEAYNRINTRPDYQIHCSRETRAGSWITERVCKPQFVDTATAAESREFVDAITMPGGDLGNVTPAATMIAAKRPDYEKHLLKVINGNPKLLQLLREHDALEKHYQEVRRRKFKGRWFVRD